MKDTGNNFGNELITYEGKEFGRKFYLFKQDKKK